MADDPDPPSSSPTHFSAAKTLERSASDASSLGVSALNNVRARRQTQRQTKTSRTSLNESPRAPAFTSTQSQGALVGSPMTKLRLGCSDVNSTSPRQLSTTRTGAEAEAAVPSTDFSAVNEAARSLSSVCPPVAAVAPAPAAADGEGTPEPASPRVKLEVAFTTPSDSSQTATRHDATSSFGSEPSIGSTFDRLSRSDTCGSPLPPRSAFHGLSRADTWNSLSTNMADAAAGRKVTVVEPDMYTSPLQALGPFCAQEINWQSIDLTTNDTLNPAGGDYEVLLSEDLQARVDISAEDFEGKGRLSPTSPVTLSSDARRQAKVPQDASLFAFAYPISDENSISHDAASGDPRLSFLKYGGFVYFTSASREVCGANALGRGIGLHFKGPFFLDDLQEHHDMRYQLYDCDRVEQATAALARFDCHPPPLSRALVCTFATCRPLSPARFVETHAC